MSADLHIDINALQQALIAMRSDLLDLRRTTKDAHAPVELDQQSVGRLSRMDAMQGQAMALEQDRRREEQISRIDAALRRIESGDYGYCVKCNEPISAKRLDLDPATAVCIDCASL